MVGISLDNSFNDRKSKSIAEKPENVARAFWKHIIAY
jgi:hypothetical protein